jgi:hypothetical protein
MANAVLITADLGCFERIEYRAMTRRAKSIVLTFFIVLALGLPRSAKAQTSPQWQVFAGYATLNDVTDQVVFRAGWAVSAAAHLTGWLSVVGDVDGQYKTIDAIGSDVRLTSHTLTGGLRAAARLGHFTEFAQVLVGVAQTTGALFGSTETIRRAVVQLGVGLDYPLRGRWAVRGELDVRLLTNGHDLRFATGIVRAFR